LEKEIAFEAGTDWDAFLTHRIQPPKEHGAAWRQREPKIVRNFPANPVTEFPLCESVRRTVAQRNRKAFLIAGR
jgi:hypothetical protein